MLRVPATRGTSDSALDKAGPADFLASLFEGQVFFSIGDARFDVWSLSPIEFAVHLYDIARDLAQGCSETIDFVESSDYIRFTRSGDSIEVYGSHDQITAHIPAADLKAAAKEFVSRMLRELGSDWPILTQNPAFKRVQSALVSDDQRPLRDAIMG